MHIKYSYSIQQQDSINKNNLLLTSMVSGISCSSDGKRLAVSRFGSRSIELYCSNTNELVDRFSTRAAASQSKNKKRYCHHHCIEDIQFCPSDHDNATRLLAVAQSDNSVFVYKWSLDLHSDNLNVMSNDDKMRIWSGRKSICNKFIDAVGISSLLWPKNYPNDIVYGKVDGSVVVGDLQSSRSRCLYKQDSVVVALASSTTTDKSYGGGLVSAHDDGTIVLYKFSDKIKICGGYSSVISQLANPAYSVAWNRTSIAVVCGNKECRFYDSDGNENYSLCIDSKGRGQIKVKAHPSTDTFIVSVGNLLHCLSKNEEGLWNTSRTICLQQKLGSISCLKWSVDGSTLYVGTTLGSIDIYDTYLHRLVKNGIVMNFLSSNDVLISRSEMPSQKMLKSSEKISKIRFFRDPFVEDRVERFVVAETGSSLIITDLDLPDSYSEIALYENEKAQRYLFDIPGIFLMIFKDEVKVYEYGYDRPLALLRTEYSSSYMLSIRVCRASQDDSAEFIKVAAYVTDSSICIKDMLTQSVSFIDHEQAIDFIELSPKADFLLFRDKLSSIYLVNTTQQKKCLLIYNTCLYAQWVPDTNVLVAQSGSEMYVWYNVTFPEQVTIREIHGSIIGIEQLNGTSKVIAEEYDGSREHYLLSDELIKVGIAVEQEKLALAADILENIITSKETETFWSQINRKAMKLEDFGLAERCAVARMDIARTFYLQVCLHNTQEYLLPGRLNLLNKELKIAEEYFISCNAANEAVEMYQSLMMFGDVSRLSTQDDRNASKLGKRKFLELLIDSKQLDSVVDVYKETDDLVVACNLFVTNNFPGKAAKVITEGNMREPTSLLKNTSQKLQDEEMYNTAGEIYVLLGENKEAMECFIKAKDFRKAIDIARQYFPDQVIQIERIWGDYLLLQGRYGSALIHFTESHAREKVFETIIKLGEWDRALKYLVDQLDPKTELHHLRSLANHFEFMNKSEEAGRLFLFARDVDKAANSLSNISNKKEALRVVGEFLTGPEYLSFVDKLAHVLERNGDQSGAALLYKKIDKYPEAAKSYIDSGEYKQALEIFTNHRLWENALELIVALPKESFTLECLKKFERENSVKDAAFIVSKIQDPGKAIDAFLATNSIDFIKAVAIECGIQSEVIETDAEGRQLHSNTSEESILNGERKIIVPEATMKSIVKQQVSDGSMEDTSCGKLQQLLDLSRNGDWGKVWEEASRHNLEVEEIRRLSAEHSKFLLKNKGKTLESLQTLMEHGLPSIKEYHTFYIELVQSILGKTKEEERNINILDEIRYLRHILQRVCLQNGVQPSAKIYKATLATQYVFMVHKCLQNDLLDLATKASISLLQFTDCIPADKVYYEAGTLAQKGGHIPLAFALLNKFVDIVEAIEEQDPSLLNIDLVEKSLLLKIAVVPKNHYTSEYDRDIVRDWVLSLCMDKSVVKHLPKQAGPSGTIYDGLYGSNEPRCVITGYPILDPSESVCISGDMYANRWDLEKFKSRTNNECPWSGQNELSIGAFS